MIDLKEFEKPIKKYDGEQYSMKHLLLTEEEMNLVPSEETSDKEKTK